VTQYMVLRGGMELAQLSDDEGTVPITIITSTIIIIIIIIIITILIPPGQRRRRAT
jgi:hypothetical protein